MFLRRSSPFRLASNSRLFTTTSTKLFKIRRVEVEDETLIKKKAEHDAIVKKQFELDVQKYGLSRVRAMAIDAHKEYLKKYSQQNREIVPVKLSHPLIVIDVANLMKHIYGTKYFSHPFAAKDLHADLRKAATVGNMKPKTINVEAPESESRPKLEIALVLEKLFRAGSFEGTVGSDDLWVRTVHAPDTREINQNAGDDAIMLVVERARAENREVILISDDKNLGLRAARMGGRLVEGKRFLQALNADKAKERDDSGEEASLWTRLRQTVEKHAMSEEAVRELEESRGFHIQTSTGGSGFGESPQAGRARNQGARTGALEDEYNLQEAAPADETQSYFTPRTSTNTTSNVSSTKELRDRLDEQHYVAKTNLRTEHGRRRRPDNHVSGWSMNERQSATYDHSSGQAVPTEQANSSIVDQQKYIRPSRARRTEKRRLEREQQQGKATSAEFREDTAAP